MNKEKQEQGTDKEDRHRCKLKINVNKVCFKCAIGFEFNTSNLSDK